MIVLDEPYVSITLINWLEESQHPVLDNAVARSIVRDGRCLNVLDQREAICRINKGERVYTNSENALSWIVENTQNPHLTRAINLFKDKSAMRRILSPLDPGLFFKTYSIDELFKLEPAKLQTPLVLKPSVGFCSVGVYTIQTIEDWRHALTDIQNNASSWHDRYPESVVGSGSFILEGYLEGTEFALDAYFDQQGKAHVLNILRHDFSSKDDTSDRMYVTSSTLLRDKKTLFTTWLTRVNALVGVRNFPLHAEVRVSGEHVSPIEFNPLRFAGLGGTDLSYYAYGYRTYEAFLTDSDPDFVSSFAEGENKVYSMSLLNPPEGVSGNEKFDYDALVDHFSQVLDLRKFEVDRIGHYGFLFLETDAETAEELEYLKNTDLREFLR